MRNVFRKRASRNTVAPMLKRTSVACAIGLGTIVPLCAAHAQTEPPAGVEELVITGRLGTGSARTTTTLAAETFATEIEGLSPLAVLKELPGVNVQTSDPFGLYELNNRLRIRGFDINQIGLSLDGMPFMGSKDEGSVITRLVLSENLANVQVSPGSGDVSQPAMSALGGAIRYVSADPHRELGGKIAHTFGPYDMSRTFVRLDTPEIGNTGIAGYVSGSRASVGQFENRRYQNLYDRFESKFVHDLGPHTLSYSFRWAQGSDHDTQNVTNEFVPNYDAGGQLNSMVTGDPAVDNVWIGYWRNDFNTRVFSVNGKFALSDEVSLEVTPYYHQNFSRIFWGLSPQVGIDGYDSALAGTPGRTDISPPNGLPVQRDGQRTLERTGVTSHLTWQTDNNTLEIGGWIERHDYKLYQPLNNTDPVTGEMIRIPYIIIETDYVVETDVLSAYVKETRRMLDDRLTLQVGAKALTTERRLTGYANPQDFFASVRRDETNEGKDSFQPQFGLTYDFTARVEGFFNYAENFGSIPSAGMASVVYNPDLRPESSKNTDIGVRYLGDNWSGFLSGFHVKYDDRILSFSGATRGGLSGSTYLNANGVETSGAELMTEYRPAPGWRIQSSLSYVDSKFVENYFEFDGNGELTVLREVDGNTLPDQPEIIASASVSWTGENWAWALDGQYMDERFTNGANTSLVEDYSLLNASVTYTGPVGTRFEGARFQVAAYNALDKKYVSSISPNSTTGAGTRKRGYPRALYFNVSYDF